ncbi:RNA-directed DNA polymerase, eukaryota, reverse transcriptase zinc-binding domain protein [Tanacetum coccineum]
MFSDGINDMSDIGGGNDLKSNKVVDNGDNNMEDVELDGFTDENHAEKRQENVEEEDVRVEECLDDGNSKGPECNRNDRNEYEASNTQKTYAKVVTKDLKVVNNKLDFIPTVINEEGSEFVIFDEDLVEKESAQWKLTVCDHFVGYRTSVHELRYNIRRMWSKWGIDDIDMRVDGTCMFRFRSEEGMNKVLELGPWLVNNKPLFMQKWDLIIGMDKIEQTKVPLWVTLVNIPMEAWSSEGISALASSLGKPLQMDNMTARRCQFGEGRLDFARVLVEFDVVKGCKEKIEIQYRDMNKNVKGTKQVNVEYAWKPKICSHCHVIRHSFDNCTKREKSIEEKERDAKKEEDMTRQRMEENKRRMNSVNGMENRRFMDRKQYRDGRFFNAGPKSNEVKSNKGVMWRKKDRNEGIYNRQKNKGQQNNEKNQHDERAKTGNKYDVLNVLEDDNDELKILKGRMIKEINRMKEDEELNGDIEDVLEVNSGIAKEVNTEEVRGIEIRRLWEDLRRMKSFSTRWPWILMGDFNVTLKIEEHSAGGSRLNGVGKKDEEYESALKNMAWKNGNLFQHVKKLEEDLKKAQEEVVANPKGLFNKKLTKREADFMVRDVSDIEVKDAIFGIGDDKAPGPDGFIATFFKKRWDIVGKDVCRAFKDFFKTNKLLGEVNATLITLVPKIQHPSRVSEYRPIACCNVVYKCINNLLITQELLKGYNRKKGSQRCALKIDIAKAYDTVNWKFLENILGQFGFHEKLIRWVMTCVSSVAFSICVNGERFGYFKSGRGLRQGDPMSPYLFTLVMEVLTLMVQRKVANSNHFKYHWGCKEIKLTQLCFADDLLMLCNRDYKYVEVLKEGLMEFSKASGLIPNMNKSTIFFRSVKDCERRIILEVMPFTVGKLPMKYLGVPLITKNIGISKCNQLVERVKQKVNDWENKTLSYVGRLQLISSVLDSMQIYWVSHPDNGGNSGMQHNDQS